MDRQHSVAIAQDFSFLASAGQVRRFVELGLLVQVPRTAHVDLIGVSYPYARPAVRTFVARLGVQYHAACGEPLVVTSLTRPADEQPRNASVESVHPAGMAVDLRISNNGRCRSWLEKTLMSLEGAGVLDATRERRPPHYHVAVFPDRYLAYVGAIERRAAEAATSDDAAATDVAELSGPSADDPGVTQAYRVRPGDSLWSLARRSGVSVTALQQLNGMRGTKLVAGSTIQLPTGRR